jgi:hypothetical protein
MTKSQIFKAAHKLASKKQANEKRAYKNPKSYAALLSISLVIQYRIAKKIKQNEALAELYTANEERLAIWRNNGSDDAVQAKRTKKNLNNLIQSTMTRTEKLQSKLLQAIKQHNTTPNKIKERKSSNPFPIGTKAVYEFCRTGYATDSHKWKLLEYFDNN